MKKLTIKHAVRIAAVLSAMASTTSAVDAQILVNYFDFTNQGTVSAGGSVTDTMGNATATLNNNASTSLTSSGLTIASGGAAQSTGVNLTSSSTSELTGSFTIQDWVTLSALTANTVLYGANNGNVNGFVGNGVQVGTLVGAIRGGGPTISGFVSGGGQFGIGLADSAPAASVGTLYDVVLSYNASTTTFTEYLNGTQVATLDDPSFGSLALATSASPQTTGQSGFTIGGATNEPFNGDTSAAETTSDFLIYNGALTSSEVSALNVSGAGASVSAIDADIGAVPEPSTWALILVGLGGMFFIQRSRRLIKG